LGKGSSFGAVDSLLRAVAVIGGSGAAGGGGGGAATTGGAGAAAGAALTSDFAASTGRDLRGLSHLSQRIPDEISRPHMKHFWAIRMLRD
jgi:hypothetical protein